MHVVRPHGAPIWCALHHVHDDDDTMLRQVLLLQRDVPKATKFYQEGLGLRVKVLTERWAELDAGSTTLALKAVEGCESLLAYLQGRRLADHITMPEAAVGRLTAPRATRLFCPSAWLTCSRLSATCCSLVQR